MYLRDEKGRFSKGSNHSPEVLEKKRNNWLGEKNPNFGKHLSEITRKKLSIAHSGKKLSEEHIRKIVENNKNRIRSEAFKQKMSMITKGERNSQWKGGRRKQSGYIMCLKPNHPNSSKEGYVFEHRLVMEEFLGRYLKPEEIIHHKNEIRDDNRIENLMLFSNIAEHLKYHATLKKQKVI